jgi:putative DNA methylase
MEGYDEANEELAREIQLAHPGGAVLLDPFSGRAVIPHEAARLGVRAWGIDYSPVATLAGTLLADYPLRDWSAEPVLPFGDAENRQASFAARRLVDDVRLFLDEVGRRFNAAMAPYYPEYDGRQPWGYLWAQTLPCQECGRRFPLVGSLVLRHPLRRRDDPGQSFRVDVDRGSDRFRATVCEGSPRSDPTLRARLREDGTARRGKVMVCPFCGHIHPREVRVRLSTEGHLEDTLLLAADIHEGERKVFREPTDDERTAATDGARDLPKEPPLDAGLPAIPNEAIPAGATDTVKAAFNGARTYGDLCVARQTLAFVRLAKVIDAVASDARRAGVSDDYAAALAGYAGATLVRKMKYSTRGAAIQSMSYPNKNPVAVRHVFSNEANIGFSYDFFEVGLGDGPGTWKSLADDTVSILKSQGRRARGRPAQVQRGSALSLRLRDSSVSAVVTDPPYDKMIEYTDASDLFYVWLKRALRTTFPDFGVTADPRGLQEKDEKVIVARVQPPGEHRTREHYDRCLTKAFTEAARVVKNDGVITIVFGHGDLAIWHRLLKVLQGAELVLTGSWPARTETGGGAGSANIVTTLTLACRKAPAGREDGRKDVVEGEIRRAVRERVPSWERAQLALTDQLMASAGPAMETVGRYDTVLDQYGNPVESHHFLITARRAVEEAAAIKIESQPLEAFDRRSRFALFWARLYGRGAAPKSEAVWQALAADLPRSEQDGLLVESEKRGVRLAYAREVAKPIKPGAATIDVALAVARAWAGGLDAVGQVLSDAGRDEHDDQLWAAMAYLSTRLPEGDPDRLAWSGLARARHAVGGAVRRTVDAMATKADGGQLRLFNGTEGGS